MAGRLVQAAGGHHGHHFTVCRARPSFPPPCIVGSTAAIRRHALTAPAQDEHAEALEAHKKAGQALKLMSVTTLALLALLIRIAA